MNLAAIAKSPDYVAEQHELRLRRTRIGCMLTLTLVPLGSLLDLAGYPEQFWSIFAARMLCDVFLLPIFLLLFTQIGKRYIVLLSTLWAFSPSVTIAWMIYVTEGSLSPFYAGLNLGIIGTCILLPYGLWESLLYCLGVLGCYAVACGLHTKSPFSPPAFINNVLFIVMTSTICITACYFYSWARVKDYLLRFQLRERNEQLQQLDEMKNRFFANVSHELRTPLTLLLAPTRHLLDTQHNLSTEVAESLHLIERNALRLLRLINDLLELVRFDTGRSRGQLERIDITQMLTSLVEASVPLAIQQDIHLASQLADQPCFVHANAGQLEKVFLNLLVNAIKFTPEQGKVSVTCVMEASRVVIEVSDTGVGISPADLPHIFERFRQGDLVDERKHQGLGLGLALAQEIVTAHAGILSVSSEIGRGSRFKVILPRNDEVLSSGPAREDYLSNIHREAQHSVITITPTTHDNGARGLPEVLVVDDEPDMRSFLVSILSRQFSVREAIDGESALSSLTSSPPAIIVLDMMMPGISGVEVCQAIRARAEMADTKILMLTARMDEKLKLEALVAGADDFLNKPFSTAEVLARVSTLIEAARLQQSLRVRTVELEQALGELKAAESRLVQSEKMHAIGSLAAGLLHEFNNPLNHTLMAVACGRQSLSRLRAEPAAQLNGTNRHVEGIAETLDDVEGGLERISGIISDLRTFAHPESIDLRKPFLLRQTVDTAIGFVGNDILGIQLTVEIDDALMVLGAPSHITQVFVNMLLNAAHAARLVQDQRTPSIRIKASPTAGDRVLVAVLDNGSGMTEETRKRIFDPFFTTKDVGEGTGLGLSVCHTILKQHGSDIEVQSAFGKHTTFHFSLPLAQPGAN